MSARARLPLSVAAVAALGAVAMAAGVFLMLKSCTGDCINTTMGVVFAVFGLLAFTSLVPNTLGLACFMASVGFALFLGLVFLFAKKPAGIVPPVLFVLLAFAEKDLARAYYAHPRVEAGSELP